jgi:hypothetical protein
LQAPIVGRVQEILAARRGYGGSRKLRLIDEHDLQSNRAILPVYACKLRNKRAGWVPFAGIRLCLHKRQQDGFTTVISQPKVPAPHEVQIKVGRGAVMIFAGGRGFL